MTECLACGKPVRHTGRANLCSGCISTGNCYIPTGEEYERLKEELKRQHMLSKRYATGKDSPPTSKLAGGSISSIRVNGIRRYAR